ncbi:Cell cycle checkpoint protein rad17 [Boothiomyces sp. JEL0866]|nr:Cell cycle checkpoint protein rad17 [Boothiomyces sp. JEL0866]
MKTKFKSKRRKTVIRIGYDSDEDPIVEITELKRKPRVSTQMLVTKHQPMFTVELAVNKKKIDQVRNWMQAVIRNTHPNILVLSGPAGCGKTATVKCLAKELKCELIEWENITDASIFDSVFDSKFDVETTADNFCNFMETNGTGSLLSFDHTKNETGSFILIEDYPNVMHDRVRNKVHEAFQKFTENRVAVPIIIIISDVNISTENNELPITKRELLPMNVLGSNVCMEISFNPIARTFVSKALNRICRLEGITLSREIIESLSVSCGGDIRTAINAIQFSNLIETSSVVMQREADISLFHVIGKILHCKRESVEAPGETLLHPDLHYLRRNKLKFNPEDLLDSLNVGVPYFLSFLHENYTSYCDPDEAEYVTGSSYFSAADFLNANFQISKQISLYEFSVAVRGLLFSWTCNRVVPKLGFFQFKKPDKWQAEKIKRENVQTTDSLVEYMNENYALESSDIGLSRNFARKSIYIEVIPYLGIMNKYKSPVANLGNGYRRFLSKICNYNIKMRSYNVREEEINMHMDVIDTSEKENWSKRQFEKLNRESLCDLYLLDDDIEN